ALGRRLSSSTFRLPIFAALTLFVGIVLLAASFYANAQAAWGVQLLAVAVLLWMGCASDSLLDWRRSWTFVTAGMLALLALLLISRAQATSVLVVPFGFLALSAVATKRAPSRPNVGLLGLSMVGTAAATV